MKPIRLPHSLARSSSTTDACDVFTSRLRSRHLLNWKKIQRRLAWPLRKDDTQYVRFVHRVRCRSPARSYVERVKRLLARPWWFTVATRRLTIPRRVVRHVTALEKFYVFFARLVLVVFFRLFLGIFYTFFMHFLCIFRHFLGIFMHFLHVRARHPSFASSRHPSFASLASSSSTVARVPTPLDDVQASRRRSRRRRRWRRSCAPPRRARSIATLCARREI